MSDSENNASYLDFNMSEVPEMTTVEPGEYQVRCLGAEPKTSQNSGSAYVGLRLEVVDEPTAKDMNFVVMLPAQEDDQKKRNVKLNRLRDVCKAFGVPYDNGIDLNDFTGAEAWAHLEIEDDPAYGAQNRVRRLITPQ